MRPFLNLILVSMCLQVFLTHICCSDAAAQQNNLSDIVRLKNGAYVRGTIIEKRTDGGVRVLLPTGEMREHIGSEVAYAGPITAEPTAVPFKEAPKSEPSHHALFVELFGHGVFYNLNYEYRRTPDLVLRASFSLQPGWYDCLFDSSDCRQGLWFVPGLAVAKLFFEGAHHLELGLGGGAIVSTKDGWLTAYLTPQLGYRFEPDEGGFLFRLTFTPLVGASEEYLIFPWGGMSFGFSW